MAYELKDRQGNPVQRDGEQVFVSDAETAIKAVNLDRRELTIIGSTETKDRDGDVILMKGWSFDNYAKNPVFLWGHNYAAVPIGATKRLTRRRDPARLEFLIRFPTEQGIYPFADMVLQLYADKIIKASSVGFIPRKWEPLEKDEEEDSMMYRPGRRFLKQELLELSGCAVPSNPEAVTDMLKGYQRFEKLAEASQENIIGLLLNGPTSGADGEKEIKEAVEEESREMEFVDEFEGSKHFVPENYPEEKKEESDGGMQRNEGEQREDKETDDTPETICFRVSEEVEVQDLEGAKIVTMEIEVEGEELRLEDVEERPYPNEHACRLNPPGKYERFARRNCYKKSDGKCIDYIFGIKEGKSEVQALRYKKDVWTASAARSHCSDNKGSFEAAAGSSSVDNETENVRYTQIEQYLNDGIDDTLKPVFLVYNEETKQVELIEHVCDSNEEDKEPNEADSYWESMLKTEQPSAITQSKEAPKQNPPEKKLKPILTPEQGEVITSTVRGLKDRFPKLFRR